MSLLTHIHHSAQAELRKRFDLTPVSLKHPFPERPWRSLKLMRIDGEVYSSEKLLRAVFIRPRLPVYFSVYSMFIRPRVEYDLPVFAGEVMCTGRRKMVIVDIHRTGKTHHDDSELFDRMIAVRDSFQDLMKYTKKQSGGVQEVFSKAACQVVIPPELDACAARLFMTYLTMFCDLVEQAEPQSGEALERTKTVFDNYLKTLVDHDPGVRVWKMLFGEKGGLERSMDMHFGM